MVQVFPEDNSETTDPDNKQSLLIQPNLIPLSSVRMEAAACWGTYSSTTITRSNLPKTLKVLDLDPDTVISDRALFYERVR